MANVDKPNGFTPVGHLLGLPWSGGLHLYSIAVGYNVALFPGDLVLKAGSADATGRYATIQIATVGAPILGAIVSVVQDPTNLGLLYSPASTAGYAWVADDPYIIFEAQEDDVDGTTLSADEVGLNADFLTGGGDTTRQRSIMEIDRSTANVGSDIGLKILGLAPREDNELGAYSKWWVTINEHFYNAPTAGI
jgi:hypothetical protein